MNYGSLFFTFIRVMKLIVKFFWKLFGPILVWTGLIWPGALVLIASFGFKVSVLLWIIAWVACVYTLAQSIMRRVVGNPKFRLYYLVTGTPAPAADEPIDVDVIE